MANKSSHSLSLTKVQQEIDTSLPIIRCVQWCSFMLSTRYLTGV